MPGTGTLINTAAIIIGGLLGLTIGRFIPSRVQDSLLKASGVCVLFIGINGALQAMATASTMMLIGSMALGTLLGAFLDIEGRMEQLGAYLKQKSGSGSDSQFIDAFVTSSLTVCIGAMAVVGAIQDGILHDPATLIAKAVLDLIIIMVMTVSLGKGCLFSALPVFAFQGGVTLLSLPLQNVMTEPALANLSLTGSVLVFCVGVNLVWGKKVKVADMLPSLIFAVVWAFLPIK